MKINILFICLPFIFISATGFALPNKLSHSDNDDAFKAAGYKLVGNQWFSECGLDAMSEDVEYLRYWPGEIDNVRDINEDGYPEAIITDGGLYCYGHTDKGFSIVSKESSGMWKLITSHSGIPRFLDTKGVGGWPDILLAGPGFCFPVVRWDGNKYKLHHFESDDGKSCEKYP